MPCPHNSVTLRWSDITCGTAETVTNGGTLTLTDTTTTASDFRLLSADTGTTGNAITLANETWTHWLDHQQEHMQWREERRRMEWPRATGGDWVARGGRISGAGPSLDFAPLRAVGGVSPDDKAEVLLRANLSPAQQAQLTRYGYFVAHAASGRRYRIKRGRAGNVEQIDRRGEIIARLCIHTRGWVPNYDNMLAQKLMLETNEQEFLRLANSHWGRPLGLAA